MVKEKILLVEDEEDILELVRYNLDREGYRVIAVATGEKALKALKEETYDLVVLDLMLPGVDGLEVCKRIKSDPETGDVPVIMLTARSEEADVVTGLELGADDYITKPFTSVELVAAIRTRLEKQRVIEKERLQALSRRLVALQENERGLIVSELNGTIGDLLTGLKVMLSMSKRLPADTLNARFDEMRLVIDEIILRIDTLSNDLRPQILDELGILPALLQYFDNYTKQRHVKVMFRHTGLEQRFSQALETVMYRFVH